MRKIKLSELKNIAKIIATAMLKEHGKYFCEMDGEMVEVIND